MKKTIKTWMFATIFLATSSATYAQGNNLQCDNQRGNRQSHEQRIEQRANNIAKQLGLDTKTSKKFLDVFKKEQNDMMEMMPRRGGGIPPRGERPQGERPQGNPPARPQGERPQGNPPAMNGNQPGGRPQMSEDDKKKMDSLKQKYNKKYAKFLSQDQISKMYQLQEQERQKGRPSGNRQTPQAKK